MSLHPLPSPGSWPPVISWVGDASLGRMKGMIITRFAVHAYKNTKALKFGCRLRFWTLCSIAEGLPTWRRAQEGTLVCFHVDHSKPLEGCSFSLVSHRRHMPSWRLIAAGANVTASKNAARSADENDYRLKHARSTTQRKTNLRFLLST